MSLYNAEISAGSLMIPESRRIARLLLTHPTQAQWVDALKRDNILQKNAPATARRQARLIRNRLDTLEEEAWGMIANGSQEIATQLLLAAAIKHSKILADFLGDVYAGHLRRLEPQISPAKDWEAFLTECIHRDPDAAAFSDATKAKMRQVVLRILAEANYLESTRSPRLTPPHLHPDVVAYLNRHGQTAVLCVMDHAR
jgi:hypothetical protein